MILPIYVLGQPVLRKEAEEITTDYPDLQELIKNMYETMLHADGVIETNDEMESMEEGCLSLPGIHEPVKRPTKIHVRYIDENYKEHDEWVGGFLARVMQHEFDHLDGKVFIDHLSGLRKQMIKSKVQNLVKGKVHCNYKTVHNKK